MRNYHRNLFLPANVVALSARARVVIGVFFVALLVAFFVASEAVAGVENNADHGVNHNAVLSANEPPLRVASMNYCIDFVLENWSHYPEAQFEFYPVASHQGRIETMLQLQPDIIIAGQFNSPVTLNNFRAHGLPVTVLAEPNSFASSANFYTELATALGNPLLARRYHQKMGSLTFISGTFNKVPEMNVNDPNLPARTVLALQANQWSFGGKNLLNELLEYLQLTNLAAQNGDGLVRVSLEDVIAWQPQILLLDGQLKDGATPNTFALAHLNLQHKSLRNYQQRSDVHTIYLPRELSGCMGQRLPEAINVLRQQLEARSSQ